MYQMWKETKLQLEISDSLWCFLHTVIKNRICVIYKGKKSDVDHFNHTCILNSLMYFKPCHTGSSLPLAMNQLQLCLHLLAEQVTLCIIGGHIEQQSILYISYSAIPFVRAKKLMHGTPFSLIMYAGDLTVNWKVNQSKSKHRQSEHNWLTMLKVKSLKFKSIERSV